MATKKTAPKKASKPIKKSAPAKKSAPEKKPVKANSAASKGVKPTTLAKKATPAKKAAPVKKAAPAKKTVVAKKAVPAKKAAPVKKAASVNKAIVSKKAAPVQKALVKAAPTKVAPTKAAPVKAAPAKAAPEKKPIPVKSAKAAVPAQQKNNIKAPAAKAAPVKPAASKAAPPKAGGNRPSGKKPPLIAPEIRFAQTSKAPASATEIRKALRAKEVYKDMKPVTMPKITAKTARKYEPEFTKSVLDSKAVVEPSGPTQRYSDAELLEFKELVQGKLNAAKQELAYLNGLITRKDSMSGEDSDSRYMTMEDGSLSMEREQLSQMASRQIDFIEKLEKAMMRIENKTYGICRVTGKLIDKARLRAVPHATLSMEAKTTMNRPGSGI